MEHFNFNQTVLYSFLEHLPQFYNTKFHKAILLGRFYRVSQLHYLTLVVVDVCKWSLEIILLLQSVGRSTRSSI